MAKKKIKKNEVKTYSIEQYEVHRATWLVVAPSLAEALMPARFAGCAKALSAKTQSAKVLTSPALITIRGNNRGAACIQKSLSDRARPFGSVITDARGRLRGQSIQIWICPPPEIGADMDEGGIGGKSPSGIFPPGIRLKNKEGNLLD